MRLKRREFVTLLTGAVTAWPLSLRAQHAAKIWRIGILETISAAQNAVLLSAFRQGLRQLGYLEGQNYVIEYRSADGLGDRFPDLVLELTQGNVDLIVLRGTPAAIAAKNATSTIPVVMFAIGDPFVVVPSLSHPGGNLTGLSSFTVDLDAKRMEVFKESCPQASRIAALLNMGNPPLQNTWKEIERAAQSLGVQVELFDVRKAEEIGLAFDRASRNQCNAVYVGQDGLAQANMEVIVSLAAKHRLPAIYFSKEYVEAGGLMSFGTDYRDLYRRAATYVVKILHGTKPADLPVEQPTKFELVINLRTARALELTVPATMLARADEVLE
jgi:putative ABC transport system substrate-binding protein